MHTITSIARVCRTWRRQGKKTVLVTGFFDLLHSEHVRFLQKAKAVGDILVVAVESDARARRVKGSGRPVQTQTIRCRQVSAYADYVIALGDDFDSQSAYESLLVAVRPHIYAVSSHTSFLENKQLLVAKYGGILQVVHDFNPEVSTTQILASRDTL